jgi:hypothetical protein
VLGAIGTDELSGGEAGGRTSLGDAAVEEEEASEW